MSRGFKPTHPVKLRGVVASAVLDRGLSVPAALRLLADGKLPGWSGRYELPLSSASGYVKDERTRRREALLHRADPSAVVEAVAGQVALLLAELDRRARAVNAKTTLEEIRDQARAQRELILTAKACGPSAGRQTPSERKEDSDSNAPAPDLIAQLAAGESTAQPG